MDALSIASSGLNVHSQWLNAISDNLANANDVTSTSSSAFQTRYVEATAQAGVNGVEVTGVKLGSSTGTLEYSPNNPLADKDGYVRVANVDVSEQMGAMIMAQRGYQANAAVIDRAQSMYEAGIAIGKNT